MYVIAVCVAVTQNSTNNQSTLRQRDWVNFPCKVTNYAAAEQRSSLAEPTRCVFLVDGGRVRLGIPDACSVVVYS